MTEEALPTPPPLPPPPPSLADAEAAPTPPAPPGPPPPDDPNSPGALQRAADAETLTEQGIDLSKRARWRDAIEPLRRATELSPTAGLAFYYLGDAYNHVDHLPGALSAFEAAARLLPDNWRALKGVGIVLDRMRRPQEAAAAYQKARDAQRRQP
jgi:Flp pilus assembly protein TadD